MKLGLGSVATKNAITKIAHGANLTFKLKNIRINGQMRGCSGFVQNNATGQIIYLTTEESAYSPLQGKVMFRTADNFTDYRGGRNRWADNWEEVAALLVP